MCFFLKYHRHVVVFCLFLLGVKNPLSIFLNLIYSWQTVCVAAHNRKCPSSPKLHAPPFWFYRAREMCSRRRPSNRNQKGHGNPPGQLWHLKVFSTVESRWPSLTREDSNFIFFFLSYSAVFKHTLCSFVWISSTCWRKACLSGARQVLRRLIPFKIQIHN